MAKKGRKKSVNPKKNQKKERERADSSSRCFLKTRRSQTQICELSYAEIKFPKLQEQSNKIGHRSLRSSSRPFALAPLLFTALRARSAPLHGPSRASLAWKSTEPVGATTGTGYSQERQLGDAGSAVYTPPTPTG